MSGHNDGLVELAGDAGDLLKKRGETIAVAESSSGGLVSASLLSVPGASSYFLGGGTIYTRVARDALLGLPEEVVTMRASTEDYALIVAEAVRKKLGATWGLCESGASGPTEILMVMRRVTSRLRSLARRHSRAPWKLAVPTGRAICGASLARPWTSCGRAWQGLKREPAILQGNVIFRSVVTVLWLVPVRRSFS